MGAEGSGRSTEKKKSLSETTGGGDKTDPTEREAPLASKTREEIALFENQHKKGPNNQVVPVPRRLGGGGLFTGPKRRELVHLKEDETKSNLKVVFRPKIPCKGVNPSSQADVLNRRDGDIMRRATGGLHWGTKRSEKEGLREERGDREQVRLDAQCSLINGNFGG